MKKRALISVYDKTGILDFAKFLISKGIEIISTGGTYKYLKENNIEVIEVSKITNFEEMLDGRVKTLHPNIHGGILALRDNEEHMRTLKERNIDTIDYVIVNLYPFFEKVKEDLSFEDDEDKAAALLISATGMTSFCPAFRTSFSVKLFAVLNSATVSWYFLLIEYKVSPFFTIYEVSEKTGIKQDKNNEIKNAAYFVLKSFMPYYRQKNPIF